MIECSIQRSRLSRGLVAVHGLELVCGVSFPRASFCLLCVCDKVFRQLRPAPSTRGLGYDPEGQFVAVVSANGQLQIWDIAESKPLKKKPSVARKVKRSASKR